MGADIDVDQMEKEHSAGGVLVRPEKQGRSVCLIQMKTRGGNPSWRLPKGEIESDETSPQAAVRETREETGCAGKILTGLDGIEYWYTRQGDSGSERIRKVVDFYLLEYQSGDVEQHDHEVDEAAWFSFAEALETLSYDAEKRVLQEAIHAWDAYKNF